MSNDVLDWEAACQRMMHREDLLKRLAESFLIESDQLMAELREAIARQDANSIQRAAHSLKGAANVFCATATVRAARRLESIGESGNLGNVDPTWTALEEEVSRLRKALRGYSAQ